jgi:hypothetical protein
VSVFINVLFNAILVTAHGHSSAVRRGCVLSRDAKSFTEIRILHRFTLTLPVITASEIPGAVTSRFNQQTHFKSSRIILAVTGRLGHKR